MEKIIEKIAKLLRLAESDNINEATTAAAQAQRLMDRHKIDAHSRLEDEVAPLEEDIIDCDDALDYLRKRVAWKTHLSAVIADANQCYPYTRRASICLVGRPTDIQAVRYMYAYLVREVERLCDRDCKGCGRTYRNNYRLGAVQTLKRKFSQQRADTIREIKQETRGVAGDRALVRIDNAVAKMVQQKKEVGIWVNKNMNLGAAPSRRGGTYNPDAWRKGEEAAESIRLTQARGSLGSGQ